MMTEEKLYERLMKHKSKHGITQETLQHYHWAIDTLRQQSTNNNSSSQERI